ncbi:MAG TPA: hypothetical protein VG410_08085 [Solirubrobacteraceae bacterium]|nr:hypothetical protein [Solirubrobacteraceae bacterium]
MAGTRQHNSLTRVETLLDPLLSRDPSGRLWLPALLAATPHGRAALGELVDEPGGLEIPLAVYGVNGRLAAFEYQVPPPRGLLAWFIEHPDELAWPAHAQLSSEVTTLRRAMLNDDPPGSRARAQDRARERLATAAPLLPDWWRFEDVTRPDAVLATDRLVVLVDGDDVPTQEPSACDDWYPSRSRLIRVLEAAKQLAHGRRWATLVLGAGQPFDDALDDRLETGAPHLSAAERDELRASYLGSLTFEQAAAVTHLDSGA